MTPRQRRFNARYLKHVVQSRPPFSRQFDPLIFQPDQKRFASVSVRRSYNWIVTQTPNGGISS